MTQLLKEKHINSVRKTSQPAHEKAVVEAFADIFSKLIPFEKYREQTGKWSRKSRYTEKEESQYTKFK